MKVPDPLKKGVVLFGDHQHAPADAQRLAQYGAFYEENKRLLDALLFFWRAGHAEGMERIAQRALEEGDFFLYRQATAYLERPMEKQDLTTLARNAREKGKLAYALSAAREAGDQKAEAEIRRLMGDSRDEENDPTA